MIMHTSLGRNNSTIFATGPFPHPARLLQATAASLVRNLEFRRHSLWEQDLAHTISWDHLPLLIETLAKNSGHHILGAPCPGFC